MLFNMFNLSIYLRIEVMLGILTDNLDNKLKIACSEKVFYLAHTTKSLLILRILLTLI